MSGFVSPKTLTSGETAAAMGPNMETLFNIEFVAEGVILDYGCSQECYLFKAIFL